MTSHQDDDPTCRESELSLGALVLGALDPAERLEVEAHVAECSRCRDALAQLAPLPGLLNRLQPAQAEAGLPRPPTRLLEEAMQRAAHPPASGAGPGGAAAARIDRRWWLVAGVAAAAAVLATLAVLATRGADSPPPVAAPTATTTGPHTTGPRTETVLWDGTSADGRIQASVLLTPQSSGSRLAMTLTGVRPGQTCDLVIESRDGTREVTASWQATYEGAATITGSTSSWPQQINRMLVATPAGDTLVRLWPPG